MKAIGILFVFLFAITLNSQAQSIPLVEEVESFISDQNILISYRDGGAVYGTFYFMEIHYCASGYYGLYGNTNKQTVLGNEQQSNWQEFGTWKVIEQNGLVGIQYLATSGAQQFVPVYKLENGDFFIKEGISIVKQGPAICY